MKNLLIVDDNKKYETILSNFFSQLGYHVETALTGKEGLDKVRERGVDYYSVIVTDITMESQLAGIYMLGDIRKMKFAGTVVVASTGFDVPLVVPLSRLFLGRYGVHYLVPKTTVLKNQLEFLPMQFFGEPIKEFREIQAAS